MQLKSKLLNLQCSSKSKYIIALVLTLVILLQLISITNVIVNEKKGYHSDETYSYGLANSFYQPFISSDTVYSNYEETDGIFVNVWHSGDELRNYITVQPGQQFRYDSVWYNQSQDRHPPLYYTVLHTICSFFPNTFSPVFGYLINYICFIVTQIFLYKLSRNLLKSKFLALLVCVLWGFSGGAVDLTIFIRMYGMLTMFCVILMYLHTKLYAYQGTPPKRIYFQLFIITTCGALTQHLFLVAAFVTAVCFCIYYLIKKQFKNFFKYGFSMLGGALLTFVIFPPEFSQLFSEGESSGSFGFFWNQMQWSKRLIQSGVFGWTGSEWIYLLYLVPTFLGIVILFSVPMLYLLRDKPKVQNILQSIKALPKRIGSVSWKKLPKRFWNFLKNVNPVFYILIINILVVCALTSYSLIFATMSYVNRYLFIIYPLVAVVLVCLISLILTKAKHQKMIVSVILMSLIVYSVFFAGTNYFFTFDDERTMDSIKELTADSACIVAETSSGETWLIDTLPIEMYDVDNIFITYINMDKTIQQRMADLESNGKKVYLFVDEELRMEHEGKDCFMDYNGDFIPAKEYFSSIQSLPYAHQFDYVGKYTIFKRTYTIYRLA